MQIREIMSRYVEVIARDDDVRTAAIKMRDLNVSVIPVCDGARFVGILTDRDIAVRLAAEGYDATRTRVGEIMTRDLTYCYEDQTIDEAAIVMQFHQISRLPILDRGDELVGIISVSDISSCLAVRAGAVPLVETKEPGGFDTSEAMETATGRR
jgi:CBS domain-containing protein